MHQLIKWQKSMSVHVSELDDQHKEMISIINNLYLVLKEDADARRIQDIVSQLQTYEKCHFEAEEALMVHCGYPGLEEHKAMHAVMQKKMAEFKTGLENGDVLPLVKLLPFLVEYLHDHIIKQDGKFAEFLRRHKSCAKQLPDKFPEKST
ncbi:bacteriohemerythrin [bacterium]|nr:bacteriohemerythrin [bacterium]